MADDMLSHSSIFCQSVKTFHCLEFNHQQWCQFWQLLTVGSAMSDCLLTLRHSAGFTGELGNCVEHYAKRWLSVSQELLPVFEAVKIRTDQLG